MARAPRPGETNTRLEPLLGPSGCARLQAALIRHTAAWVATAAERAWVAFTPRDARAEIAALVPADTTLLEQRGDDLGARLRFATGDVFEEHAGPLAVVGTDAPLLGPAHFRAAAEELRRGADAALVPALDGGYALIALARPAPQAFSLPAGAWGGADVLALTLNALRRDGRSCAVLAPVRDLDTADDALALFADPRCPAGVRAALSAARAP